MVDSKFDFPTFQMTYIDSRSRMSRRLQNAEISGLLVIEVGRKRDLEILIPTFWSVFALVTRFSVFWADLIQDYVKNYVKIFT